VINLCRYHSELGAKYLVFTAKHHDGFCMWDTKTTPYNVMNSPMKKDVLGELRASADKYGLKFGIYFSWMEFAKRTVTIKFMKNVVKPQLEELRKYKPHLWWMDGDWVATAERLESKSFIETIHKDGAIINSRLGKGSKGGGDYNNFDDRFIPKSKLDEKWESCQTIGLSWGYNAMQTDTEQNSYRIVSDL